jgi:hypothetical protein
MACCASKACRRGHIRQRPPLRSRIPGLAGPPTPELGGRTQRHLIFYTTSAGGRVTISLGKGTVTSTSAPGCTMRISPMTGWFQAATRLGPGALITSGRQDE